MPLTKEQINEIKEQVLKEYEDGENDYVDLAIIKAIQLTEQECERTYLKEKGEITKEQIKLLLQKQEKEILSKFQSHKGTIKTIEEGFEFLDRETKCSICKKVYWDKPCPDCRRKEIKEQAEEFYNKLAVIIEHLYI